MGMGEDHFFRMQAVLKKSWKWRLEAGDDTFKRWISFIRCVR